MKYATTTLNPDLILAFDDREYEGLQADGIIDREVETDEDGNEPQEYTDQQERLAEERAKAEAEAEGNQVESDIVIKREDGSEVGQPDKASQAAAEAAGQGDGESADTGDDGEPKEAEQAKTESPGGRRVKKTPAKDAE